MLYYFAKLLMILFYNHSQDFRAGVVHHQHERREKLYPKPKGGE